MLNGELDRAVVTAGEALEIAERLELDDIRVHAMTTLGSTRGFARDLGGLELIEQSLALALELNNAEAIVRGYKNLSSHLFDFGELDRSAALLLEAETAAARFGDAFNLRWFAVEGVLLLYHHGRWDEALRIADDFLAEVESGTPHYMEAAAREMRSPMLLARGDVAGALSESTRALEFGRGSGQAQVLMPALAVHVCALAAAGKIDEAGAVADELLAAASPAHGPTSWASEIAPVLHALEDHTPWEAGALAVASGDFERAAETYATVGSLPHEAAARMLTGRREHVERALAFYESVGATRFVREAEDLLGPSAEVGRTSG